MPTIFITIRSLRFFTVHLQQKHFLKSYNFLHHKEHSVCQTFWNSSHFAIFFPFRITFRSFVTRQKPARKLRNLLWTKAIQEVNEDSQWAQFLSCIMLIFCRYPLIFKALFCLFENCGSDKSSLWYSICLVFYKSNKLCVHKITHFMFYI